MASNHADLSTSAIRRVLEAIPDIEEILRSSGIPSLSIAVVHHGDILCTRHFGFRDIREELVPDNDTRFNINSMTKALVASLVAQEIDDGRLQWATRIKDHIPDFKSRVPVIQDECTISDLLAHGTGLPNHSIWYGSQNAHLLERDQALSTFATILPIGGFRSSFNYNNWGYEIVGQVLEKVTGKSLSDLLTERIFEPLNMTRTSTMWDEDDKNNSRSYVVLDDLSSIEVGRPQMTNGKLMQAAGGVKSSLHDLTILYREMLAAMSASLFEGHDITSQNVFQRCLDIFKQQRPLPDSSIREQSYGFGWFRTQSPGQVNKLSGNAFLTPQPVIGKGVPSQLVLCHAGRMSGSMTAVFLLPEIQSAVITLQNSLGPVDAADYVAELLLERLLDVPDPVDFCSLAQAQSKRSFGHMSKIKAQLDADRQLGTFPRSLTMYVGRYWNDIHNWCIDISIEHDSLLIAWQGLDSERFPLTHYHYDVFSWWMSWNDVMKAGRFTNFPPAYWLVEFDFKGKSQVVQLRWAWDASLPNHKESFKPA